MRKKIQETRNINIIIGFNCSLRFPSNSLDLNHIFALPSIYVVCKEKCAEVYKFRETLLVKAPGSELHLTRSHPKEKRLASLAPSWADQVALNG